MTTIIILSIFYSLIVVKEEQKWENHRWTDLMNSGN